VRSGYGPQWRGKRAQAYNLLHAHRPADPLLRQQHEPPLRCLATDDSTLPGSACGREFSAGPHGVETLLYSGGCLLLMLPSRNMCRAITYTLFIHKINTQKILVRRLEGKRTFGRPRCWRQENIIYLEHDNWLFTHLYTLTSVLNATSFTITPLHKTLKIKKLNIRNCYMFRPYSAIFRLLSNLSNGYTVFSM
jgi:hypothetical protein